MTTVLRNLVDNSQAGVESARKKIDANRPAYPRHFLPEWWVIKLIYHITMQSAYIRQLERALAEHEAEKSEKSK